MAVVLAIDISFNERLSVKKTMLLDNKLSFIAAGMKN